MPEPRFPQRGFQQHAGGCGGPPLTVPLKTSLWKTLVALFAYSSSSGKKNPRSQGQSQRGRVISCKSCILGVGGTFPHLAALTISKASALAASRTVNKSPPSAYPEAQTVPPSGMSSGTPAAGRTWRVMVTRTFFMLISPISRHKRSKVAQRLPKKKAPDRCSRSGARNSLVWTTPTRWLQLCRPVIPVAPSFR